MTKPTKPSAAARAKALRKRYADRQRRIRQERDARKQCRTCGEPAAISKRTGQLAKQCARHLSCDAGRKSGLQSAEWHARRMPYVLPWAPDTSGDTEYALEWYR